MNPASCPDVSIDTTLPDEEWEEEVPQRPHSRTPSRASTSNHSEIEKRRRDRMNDLIGQLSSLVPAAFNRKLDKLSVLQLALQHINSISSTSDKELDYSGNAKHLPLNQLLYLLEKCVDSFLVVTDVDTGNILYASDSVTEHTSIPVEEFISKNWFDLIHPEDAHVFKSEVLSFCTENRISNDASSGYLNDTVSSSTGHFSQHADFNIGLRRLFVCRLKISSPSSSTASVCYSRFRCCGFLRDSSAAFAILLLTKDSEHFYAGEKFQLKIALNGRITHCDPELPRILGYLPHKLVGISYYDIVYEGDLLDVSHHHKQVLKSATQKTASYRLRCESNRCVMVDSTWRPFVNPWTSQTQFIIIIHSASSVRNDAELSAEQSTLKQLLSGKRGAGPSAVLPILGAARFGDTVHKS